MLVILTPYGAQTKNGPLDSIKKKSRSTPITAHNNPRAELCNVTKTRTIWSTQWDHYQFRQSAHAWCIVLVWFFIFPMLFPDQMSSCSGLTDLLHCIVSRLLIPTLLFSTAAAAAAEFSARSLIAHDRVCCLIYATCIIRRLWEEGQRFPCHCFTTLAKAKRQRRLKTSDSSASEHLTSAPR